MTGSTFLDDLRVLHDKQRNSRLAADELTRHRAGIERLLATVVQQQNARPGHRRRRAVRLLRTVAVEVTWTSGSARTVTLDLGTGGFSAALASPPPRGEPVAAYLQVHRGEQIRAAVRVANVARARGSVRVSFAFTEIPAEDSARLKMFVVDQLLPPSPPRSGPDQEPPLLQGLTGRALQRAG